MDDKLENVFSARSLGMYGIVFDDATNVIRQLQNLLRGPVGRANQYLQRNKKQLLSYTSTGIILDEVDIRFFSSEKSLLMSLIPLK